MQKDENPGGAGASEGRSSQCSSRNTNGANNKPGYDDDGVFNLAAWVESNRAPRRRPTPPTDDAKSGFSFAEWVNGGNGKQGTRPPAGPYTPPTPPAGADRYAAKALADECAAVAGTTEGSRNHRLNIAAFNLGQLVGAGALDRAVVEDALRVAARAAGLTDHEVGPTITSGLNAGTAQPRTISAPAVVDLGDTDVGNLGDTSSGDDNGVDPFEAAVAVQLETLRIREEARRRLNAEQRPPVELPPVTGLAALLAEPDEPTRYTVDRLAPAGGRTLATAQYKAGKTTIRDNLVRSLADGEPFLGAFNTRPGHRIGLIDNELSRNTARLWLRDQRIRNTSAVADVVMLRGNVAAFNLLDDEVRAYWAARFRDLGITYLVLDCLRPVLDALGLDEHRDAGRFLVAFDALLAEAGITDALVVHHMGHNGERARGDSRLLDWPDAIWRVVRDRDDNPDDPSAPRYFSAYGRDVDVPEARLDYEPAGRRLTYSSGSSRRTAKADAARPALIAVLAGQDLGDGLTQNQLRERLRNEHGVSFHAARAVIAAAVKDGTVVQTPGPNRSTLHFLNPSERAAASVAATNRNTGATP